MITKKKLKHLLPELKGFNFKITLILEFHKIESNDERKYSTLYLFSNTETIMNESGIDDACESIFIAVKRNIEQLLGKRSS